MTIRATLLVLAVALLAATTGSVHAQVADHLTCYQIKDPLKLKGPKPPWLDLTGPQFGSESCKIVGRTRFFCVPVTKTVTADIQRKFARERFADFVPAPLPGAETITQEKLCYRITCERRFPPDQRVTDQFGTRNVEKLKPFLLCGPATTSTGSVSFSWTVGGQSAAVGCPASSQVRIEATAGPAAVDQSVVCTLGTGQVDHLPPGAYTFRATLVDNLSNPVVDNLQVNVVAGTVAAPSPIDFVPSSATGSVSFSWTVGGQSAAVGCPASSQVRIEATAGPAAVDQSVVCTLGTGQVDHLPPGAYTFRATLVDNLSNPVVDNLQVNVVAGTVAAPSPIDFVPIDVPATL